MRALLDYTHLCEEDPAGISTTLKKYGGMEAVIHCVKKPPPAKKKKKRGKH